MNTLPPHDLNSNLTKVCSSCKKDFPATIEFFHLASKGRYGLSAKCKGCRSTKKSSEHLPEGHKRCVKCAKIFPATLDFFHHRNGAKDGLRNECRACKSHMDKLYRETPEIHNQLLAKKQAYYDRDDIRERRRLKDRTEQARNHRKNYRKQPHVAAYERAYERAYHSNADVQEHYRIHRQNYNASPDIQEKRRNYRSQPRVKAIYRSHSHKRRSLKLNAGGTHTPEQIQEQYRRQKGKCYYCLHKVEWGKHQIDHVVPLSRGGTNDISNLVIACAPCNLSKNNKLPHEWARGNRLL